MFTENKDYDSFSSKYQNNEQEILVLTSDKSGGAAKFYNSWNASQYFLAYIDLDTNELKNKDGLINWLISDKDENENGISFPYHFKSGTIYHLKVRELIDKIVPEGMLPCAYNSFMVVEVLKENVENDELLSILAEYRNPVKIVDEKLGEFELNKDYGCFSGEIKWLNECISVSLDVDIEDEDSWIKTLELLNQFFNEQEKRDFEFRTFAGKQLTDLANDWLEEENEEITENDFMNRISLSELVITFEGDYIAYYDDDNIFYGHIIELSGNIKTGLSSAKIAG
ncbi:DUF2262 domain-containing protein [Flavobacterium sp. GSB-24]|uniref:DUF2262 domain-containing protein n=1 Tax=Flavobacterium sp. GSB-24 TaxID=2994319 RepID=UPI0024937BA0|nr:DUF2262 domain-containing protein [Flavobacterium sp. GSB-24]BDU24048.1 hypothetical protein FLGSB24_07920 [Flavobacterium sp. GSB-24]